MTEEQASAFDANGEEDDHQSSLLWEEDGPTSFSPVPFIFHASGHRAHDCEKRTAPAQDLRPKCTRLHQAAPYRCLGRRRAREGIISAAAVRRQEGACADVYGHSIAGERRNCTGRPKTPAYFRSLRVNSAVVPKMMARALGRCLWGCVTTTSDQGNRYGGPWLGFHFKIWEKLDEIQDQWLQEFWYSIAIVPNLLIPFF